MSRYVARKRIDAQFKAVILCALVFAFAVGLFGLVLGDGGSYFCFG